MKISQIIPNKDNPRLIKDSKFEKLVNSIVEFPQMMQIRPIVIDENFIDLAGNMRLKAIQEIKKRGKDAILKYLTPIGKESNINILNQIFDGNMPDGWVRQESELTEEQKQEFILKDNVSYGSFDFDILANEWDAELLNDWGLDVPVFDHENDESSQEKEVSTKMLIKCTDANDLAELFKELTGRGYNCELK